MDVSIIIANWNTQGILHNCLASIYRETKDIQFEVILVDNASTDGSVEMVQSSFPQVHLIRNSRNLGFAAANTRGIAVARGRYMLLLNSDTIVLDNAISKTVFFADSHPEAGVVACRVCNPDRTLQSSCFMFPSLLNMVLLVTYLHRLFPRSRFFGRERMIWYDWSRVHEVDIVAGCFMLVRREAINQVGAMDERFFMYGEEADWCYRFHKAGWKILFTPSAEIIHLGAASSKLVKHEMILQLYRSILLFFKKHKNPLVYATTCFLVVMFFVLRIPYWLGRAIWSPSTRSRSLQMTKTYVSGIFSTLAGRQEWFGRR